MALPSRTAETPATNCDRGCCFGIKRAKLWQPRMIVTCMLLGMYICPTANGEQDTVGASVDDTNINTNTTSNTTRPHNASVIEDRSLPKVVPPTTSEQPTTPPKIEEASTMDTKANLKAGEAGDSTLTTKPTDDAHDDLRMTVFESIFGRDLIGSAPTNSSVLTRNELGDDCEIVAIFFSANACDRCRDFVPILTYTYMMLNSVKQRFQVVFVSSDDTLDAFEQHRKLMPWLALPFGNHEARRGFFQWFVLQNYDAQFTGIPNLIMLNRNGETVSTNGMQIILADIQGERFPWTVQSSHDNNDDDDDVRNANNLSGINRQEKFVLASDVADVLPGSGMPLAMLFGPQLVATHGNVASVADTEWMLGRCKHVIVYFSALWCKPCAGVTQLLRTLTHSLNTGDQRVVEVVLVSSDRTEELYLTHLTTHPWLALPYTSRKIKQALRGRFDVRGIPSLMVIDTHTADVVTYDGLAMLKKDPTGVVFPWGSQQQQPQTVALDLAAGGFDMHGEPCTCETTTSPIGIPRNIMSTTYETPQRHWVPPDPVAPSSKGQKNFGFDPSLTLEVFVTPFDPEKNDGNTRFLRSAQVNAINVNHNTPTFGTENFLKRLVMRKTQPGAGSVVVIYIHDPADVIFAAEEQEIIREFETLSILSKGKVMMAAQRRCSMYCQGKGKTKFVWPSIGEGARFADPRMLVGRLDDMLALAASIPAPDNVTINLGIGPFHHMLTLYSTLNSTLAADGKYALFQNLAGFDTDLSSNELELHFKYRGQNDTRIRNAYFNTWPGIIYGAGNQLLLDQIGNYVPLRWSPFMQPNHNRWTFDCSCWAGICGKNCSSDQMLTRGKSEADLCGEGDDDTETCVSSTYNHTNANMRTKRTAPLIVVTIMVGSNAPFFDYVLQGLDNQNYPKDCIHIDMYVFERVEGSQPKPRTFTRALEVWCEKATSTYASFTLTNFTNVSWAVNESLHHAAAVDAKRWLFMTSAVVLNNSNTLRHLVHQNKTAIAPLMTRDSHYFSTFWGSTVGGAHEQCYDEDLDCVDHASKKLCNEGDFVEWMQLFCAATCGNCTKPSRDVNTIRYKRSFDYFGIVGSPVGRQEGVWRVPVVHTMIMFNHIGANKLLQGMRTDLNSTDVNVTTLEKMPLFKYTLQMVEWIHAQNGSTFVTNALSGFGTLINSDFASESMIHPELYLLEGNEALWKRKYLHENYSVEEVNTTVTPSCWDVYQLPLLSTKFCTEFIKETETFATKHDGAWSVSFNHVYNDSTSPTTHHVEFWKYGFHKSWASVLRKLVAPVLANIFNGYVFSGNVTADYFIRYNATENATLRTHNDPSTFSVNLALSQGNGVDYSGGGTHFIRQNCTVHGKMGHAIMHPGMFTHEHEALAVTNGTRYVVISYVDQV